MEPTITFTISKLRCDILADTMRQLQENPARLPEGYHSATVEPDFAMLVEPLNDHTSFFVLPSTVHQFASQPGSGTDKQRQRVLAGLFFRHVVDNRSVDAGKAGAVVNRVASAASVRSARP